MGFGEIVREFRQGAGLTQDALAEKLGCSSGYIPYLESEKRIPSLEFSVALTEACGRNAEDRQRLLEAVEAARLEREGKRFHARGAALDVMRGIISQTGSTKAGKTASTSNVIEALADSVIGARHNATIAGMDCGHGSVVEVTQDLGGDPSYRESHSNSSDIDQIAREIATDADWLELHRRLRIVFTDPQKRATVLDVVKSLEQSVRQRGNI